MTIKFPTDDEIRQWLQQLVTADEEDDAEIITEWAPHQFVDWETMVSRADAALVEGVEVALWTLANEGGELDGFMVTAWFAGQQPLRLASGHLEARHLADFDRTGVDGLTSLISGVFTEAQELVNGLGAFWGAATWLSHAPVGP